MYTRLSTHDINLIGQKISVKMINGPSEHPDQLTLEKKKPLQFGAPNVWVKNWKTPAQILEYLFER